MNKYEIKAAYNKIALSDEFKVSAKQKLLASFEDRSVDDEAVNEYHKPTSVKLTATSRSAWKTATAVCSAAAVLGFGVWGASYFSGKDIAVSDMSDPASQGGENIATSNSLGASQADDIIDMEKQSSNEVIAILDYYHVKPLNVTQTSFYIEDYPDVQFVWSDESIKAVYADGSKQTIITGMPVWSVYLSDLSGDGKQEICCGVSFGSGIIDDRIIVYDYAQGKQYELSDRGKYDYYLRMDSDKLFVVGKDYSTIRQTRYGELALTETADGEYELVIAEQNVPERLNDIHEFNHFVSAGEVYHTVENESVEDIREVRLDFILPLYWRHEWEDFNGAAYFNGVKIFEHARPVYADVAMKPNFLFNTDYADCKKVTVHEEEGGTDDDLFEYYIHTSTPSEYEDDGSLDEYKYIVNSGGYSITLTFIADVGLQQETIDSILKSIQMSEQE